MLDSDSRKRTSSSPKRCGVRERTASVPMVRPLSPRGTDSSHTMPALRYCVGMVNRRSVA
jgi:hypothetical protein